MAEKIDRTKLVAAFSAIYFLWGGTYLAIAIGLRSIPSFLLVGSRSILAGVILLALSQLRRSPARSWRDWREAAISGLLLFVGCHGSLAYAQHFVPTGLSSIILATIPFWIVLVNLAIGDKRQMKRLAGLVPGFFGVALIAWSETSSGSSAAPISMMALLLGAALAWALGSVYAQRRAAHIPPHDLAGMQLLCGGAGLLVLSGLAGEWTSFAPREVTIPSLVALLYLALLGSVIGNTAYLWLLDRLPAPVVATYTFINPVVAGILGVTVLGEHIAWRSLIGAALVIASIVALLSLAGRDQRVENGQADHAQRIGRLGKRRG